MQTKTFWDACSDLSTGLFKTFAAIHRLCNNEIGYCFAKNDYIGKKLNKHEKSISRDISELIEKGYLFSIEIKKGCVVAERRLYPVEQAKLYMEDKTNIENLITTTYKEKDGITLYTNERYENGVKREKNTSNKNVTSKFTGNKNATGTSNENVTGTGNKNVTEKYNNINNYNNNNNNKEKKVDDDILEFLKENRVDTKAIQEAVLKYEYTLEFLKRQLEIAFKLKELGKYESAGACFSNALTKNITLTLPEEKIKQKFVSGNLGKKEQEIIKKNLENKEKRDREIERKEKLREIFETLPEHEKKYMEEKAEIIAKEKYPDNIYKVMARTESIYEIIEEYLKEKEVG